MPTLAPDFIDTIASLTVILVMTVGATLVFRPIGMAIGRRIAGKSDSQVPPEILDRLDRVSDLEDRVMEIEERLEFSERLLARRDDPIRQAPVREPGE